MELTLSVRNLCFSYGSAAVLRNISFDVPEGRIVALIGPNGSGKSTLLKCLNTFLPPQSGSVLLHGHDLRSLDIKEISKSIGYVPQSVSEVFPFPVFDVVLMGRRPHISWRVGKRDIAVVRKVVEVMGLLEVLPRYFDELSGGEKQKVAIARALAQEPAVLLLDEPTSNLDIRHQLEVMMLVRRLTEEGGLSAVMAMHDLDLAARFCDSLVMLKDRSVYRKGKPEAVLSADSVRDVYGVHAEVSIRNGKRRVYPQAPA